VTREDAARNPSRAVTRRTCAGCGQRFRTGRSDQRYCSGACRQRAHRARAQLDSFDRAIEAARLHYWSLVREKALARGVPQSQVVTDEAHFITEDGDVWTGWGPGSGGRLVGHTEPHRPGWAAWGLEAAGPPWSAPPAVPPKQAGSAKRGVAP